MEYELIFSERAEEDAKLAIDYYCQINPGLSSRFVEELFQTYRKLSRTPQYYSFISSTIKSTFRDVKLPLFPYVVIYEIRENAVYFISVMNTDRRPLFS